MEVKIGVQNSPRELTIETDASVDEVEKIVVDAITAGDAISLVDSRGRRVLVPVASLAYVELGTNTAGTVGFRS